MTDEKTEMSPMDRPIRICMMFNTSEKDTFDTKKPHIKKTCDVQQSGGELLELRLLDKKWNRSFFYLPYVYQYLT